ncbi:putative transferase, protein kinase RLK-Pelle-LRR-I-1 family [Helianthus annuus]|nr:putative transferase, protein kinase RLK-Pelle-LRR-I-1 family [Helianthus annuus]
MTNNFQTAIGKGGFGTVYLGTLKNGKQVAVKLLSESSSQGYNEFQNEVTPRPCVMVHMNNAPTYGCCAPYGGPVSNGALWGAFLKWV